LRKRKEGSCNYKSVVAFADSRLASMIHADFSAADIRHAIHLTCSVFCFVLRCVPHVYSKTKMNFCLIFDSCECLQLAGILLDTANLRDPGCTSKDKYTASLLINGAGRYGCDGLYQLCTPAHHFLSI